MICIDTNIELRRFVEGEPRQEERPRRKTFFLMKLALSEMLKFNVSVYIIMSIQECTLHVEFLKILGKSNIKIKSNLLMISLPRVVKVNDLQNRYLAISMPRVHAYSDHSCVSPCFQRFELNPLYL